MLNKFAMKPAKRAVGQRIEKSLIIAFFGGAGEEF
jgi:hypothetical protein